MDIAANTVIVPPIDELIVGTLAFLILFFVLGRRAFPQIQRTYEERTDKIEGGIRRAEEMQAEARATLEEYRRQLADARSESARIVEQARKEGGDIRREAAEEAERRAAERMARAESQVEGERAQALQALQRDVGTLAMDLAERIVGQALRDDTRQRQLVDDFIAGLSAERRVESSDAPAGV